MNYIVPLPHPHPHTYTHTHTHTHQVTLEFYEKKKGRWLLPAETVNWEVWHLRVAIVEPGTEHGEPCQ